MTLPGPAEWPVDDVSDRIGADFFRERVRASPDRTAVVDADAGASWTYAAFDDLVADRVGGLLADVTLPGSRVGVLLGTRPTFATVLFAASHVGCSIVPFDVELDDARLREQVARANLDLLVCGEETATQAAEVRPADLPVATVDESGDDGFRALRADQRGEWSTFDASLDRERLLAFTSGTTGRPKGVRLSTRNLVAGANASAARLGVEPDDRWLVCLPMYHLGGLSPVVRSALYGTTVVVQRSFDPEETASVVEDYDVTCLSLVPTMLERLLDAGWDPPAHLRFVLLGGAPARESLVDRCRERGVPVCPTYGLTETASQVATARPATAFDHPGAVGRPLRGTDVTVLGEQGEAVDPETVGEIAVDGPTVALGYLDETVTAEAFGPDGLETGDLGYRDGAGRLWVVGRVDDRIVTGGENVSPDRVADVLRAHDAVDDAVVVGVDDPEWGERVCALVVPAGDAIETDALLVHVRERLAGYEVPKEIRAVDALPRTPSGTVDRGRVREMLRG